MRQRRFLCRWDVPATKGVLLLNSTAVIACILFLAGCKPPPDEWARLPIANAEKGRQAIERAGCGSCHTIEGIAWPQGRAAPPLGSLADRALIAGRAPNRPDVLAAFIRDAPSIVPETTMPPMPLSEQESRDVAAFLYQADR